MQIQECGAVVMRGSRLPQVMGDSVQLARLFQNLIINSIKYRSASPPRIDISAERQGNDWQIAVRDNGIGIEPKYAEKVFGIFRRLHTRAERAGSGMGLAICKKVVTRHGGRIWVDSQLGEGATFWFTIPVAAGGRGRGKPN